jgi:MSHA biogenesis protein MshP
MSRRTHATVARLRRSAGVGLVTAIFLLVVLAALAAAIVSLSKAQQTSAALDLQGSLAYQAARTGAEYGVYRVLRTNIPNCLPSTTFALPAGTGLSTFTVTVTCTAYDFNMPVQTALRRRLITATACNQPSATGTCPGTNTNLDYVQRVVEVRL